MIIDVTDETFQVEVLERSNRIPVVVDLWAPWCGPCKTLGPMIEQVVNEANAGRAEPRVALVKINVDENPQASAAFRVQSIPAVYALRDGQIVSNFIGAQPEPAIRQFIDELLPSAVDEEVEALLAAGDEASLRQVLEGNPGHEQAIIALSAMLIEAGRPAEALELLARIPETEEARHLAALARTGVDEAAARHGEVEGRLEELLDQVKGNDEARQEFLDLLEVLGATHPSTAEWRKRLSNRLF